IRVNESVVGGSGRRGFRVLHAHRCLLQPFSLPERHGHRLIRMAYPERRPSTGLMSTTGVPSMASIGPTRRRLPLISRIVTGLRPTGLGRSGERVAKPPGRGVLRAERG